MSNPEMRALAALSRELEEAVQQAKLAYEFNPSSYSYSALSGCLSALEILGGYRAYLDDLARACK